MGVKCWTLLSFKKVLDYLYFYCRFLRFLDLIQVHRSLSDMHSIFLWKFPPDYSLPIHFLATSFDEQKCLLLIEVQFVGFVFHSYCLLCPKKPLPASQLQRFALYSLLEDFSFRVQSLMHLDFTFVHGVRKRTRFIFPMFISFRHLC